MIKNLAKKSTMIFAALMLVFVVTSCDKAVDSTDYSEFYSSVFSVNEPSTNIADIYVEGNETADFGEMPMPVGPDDNTGDKKPSDKKDLRPIQDIRNPFARIFAILELTPEQKAQIREFMIAHRRCEREAIMALREAQKPILEAANQERRAIMEQVKNGDLTREEAGALLRALNERVREAMQNSSEVIAAHQALRNCWDELLRNIASILTPEQLVKWERFLANVRK